jgi:hypothetical protein
MNSHYEGRKGKLWINWYSILDILSFYIRHLSILLQYLNALEPKCPQHICPRKYRRQLFPCWHSRRRLRARGRCDICRRDHGLTTGRNASAHGLCSPHVDVANCRPYTTDNCFRGHLSFFYDFSSGPEFGIVAFALSAGRFPSLWPGHYRH